MGGILGEGRIPVNAPNVIMSPASDVIMLETTQGMGSHPPEERQLSIITHVISEHYRVAFPNVTYKGSLKETKCCKWFENGISN